MRSDDDEPSAEDGGQLTLGFEVRAFDGGCALCQPWGFERARTRRVFRKGAGRTPLRIACDTNIIVEIVGSGSSLLEPFDHRELIAELSIRTSRKDRAPLHMRAIGLLLVFWSFRDVRFYAFPSQMRDAQEAIRGEADAASRARAIAALATILLEETEREHLSESCGACGRAPVRRVPRRDLSEDDLWLLGSGIRGRPGPGGRVPLDAWRVADAAVHASDVLLTNDRKLVKDVANLRQSPPTAGLVAPLAVMRPGDLVQALAQSGELGELPGGLNREIARLPAMDPHKLMHLTEAIADADLQSED